MHADHLGQQISAAIRIPPFRFRIDDVDQAPAAFRRMRQTANGPLNMRMIIDEALQSRGSLPVSRTWRLPDQKKTVATLRDKMDCVESEDVDRVSKPIQANQRLAQIASVI